MPERHISIQNIFKRYSLPDSSGEFKILQKQIRRIVRTGLFLSCATWIIVGIAVPYAMADVNSKRILRYSMNGRVRVLLFWLGRDNVGGGKVVIETTEKPELQQREEKISVLFGTQPERIPGRINRWGFGEETGYWRLAGDIPQLVSSRFSGFMRHSPEESISQLSSVKSQESGKRQFWYDSIISTVKQQESLTDIYYFPMTEEVSYSALDQVHQAFEVRRASGPADKSRNLPNNSSRYDAPQGFLLCLMHMIEETGRLFPHDKERSSKGKDKLHWPYVYNANLYQLHLERVKHHKEFRLANTASVPGQPALQRSIRNVAEADFKIINQQTGEPHLFTCWFPLEGPLKNIPIQIQDNPRWWLQVRLQLVEIQESQPANK
jgi:hypothetical protein